MHENIKSLLMGFFFFFLGILIRILRTRLRGLLKLLLRYVL